jgi:chemotaxis protein MotB
MRAMKAGILAMGLLALASTASALDWNAICCDGGYEYRHRNQWDGDNASKDMAARLAALDKERQRLADELAASQRQNANLSGRVSDLERQLADRDREFASLRSGSGDSAKLASQLSAANSDKDKMASELAAARQRIADLEAQLAAMGSAAGDKDKLAAELAAARQRIADLEKQLADCEARLAGLRNQLDQGKGSLAKAEKDLLKALQPEISKGTVSVHQSGDALTINLASSLLFDSGQDQLKTGGTDALKRVGGVLKDFPEKQVHVAGYTDNVAIKGALQKKFPSNKELSDARANSAAQALKDGGVNSNLSAAGHGDSNPIANNNTAAGRAKNRRVEVIVK